MEKSIKPVNSTKKFIIKHKTKIIAGVGAGAVLVTTFAATVYWVAVGFHNDFLEEKGLKDEFQDFMNRK